MRGGSGCRSVKGFDRLTTRPAHFSVASVIFQINSANELVLTELILENTLGGYEPEEVVALLSCFVFQERTDAEPNLTPRLESGREAILIIADRVGVVQDKHKVVAEEHRSDLKFGLIEVVYEWAKGTVGDRLYRME